VRWGDGTSDAVNYPNGRKSVNYVKKIPMLSFSRRSAYHHGRKKHTRCQSATMPFRCSTICPLARMSAHVLQILVEKLIFSSALGRETTRHRCGSTTHRCYFGVSLSHANGSTTQHGLESQPSARSARFHSPSILREGNQPQDPCKIQDCTKPCRLETI